MKKRVKGFVALILSVLLCVQLIPMNVMGAPSSVTVSETLNIDYDYDSETKIYISGGVVNVLAGGSVQGGIEVRDYGQLNVYAGGAVSDVVVLEGNGNVSFAGNITTLESWRDITLSGGSIDTMNLLGGTPDISGNVSVKDAVIGLTPTGSGTLTVSNSLNYMATEAGTANIVVSKGTSISTTPAISVLYNGVTFAIPENTDGKTIGDFYGYSLSANSLSFGSAEKGYGAVEAKTITITNTKSYPLDMYLQLNAGDIQTPFECSLKIGGTSAEFGDFVLAAGESAVLTVAPSSNLTIGDYSISGTFRTMGEETTINADFSVTEKNLIPGSASATIDDYYYGGKPANPSISSSTNGVGNTVVQYKAYMASDSTYTTVAPTGIGDYTMRVIFAGTSVYKEVVVTDNFSVSYLPVPSNPYTLSGNRGENNFYITPVRLVPAEGYLVSDTLNGEYKESIYFNASTSSKKIYLKKISTGEMTDALVISDFLVDYYAPSINDVTNGETYYTDKMDVQVYDANLREVLVNGETSLLMGTNATLQLSANGGVEEYTISAKDYAGNTTEVTIIVAAAWTESGIIPEGEVVKLNKNTAYTLDAGNWNVSGDTTTYQGGNDFYVSGEGDYTFTKQ